LPSKPLYRGVWFLTLTAAAACTDLKTNGGTSGAGGSGGGSAGAAGDTGSGGQRGGAGGAQVDAGSSGQTMVDATGTGGGIADAAGAGGGGGQGGAAGVSGQSGASGASGRSGAGGLGGASGASGQSGAGGQGGTSGAGGAGGTSSGTGCTAPGTICWDFEGGATLPAGWMPYRNEFSGTLLVDNTRPHRGIYSLHARDLQGGVEGMDGGPKKTIRFDLPANFGPILWGRAWVYTTPARPGSHAGIFNARYPRPNSTMTTIDKLDWYEVATYTQKYMAIWHPPEPPGYPEWVLVSDTSLVLDDWACLEWLFDGVNGTNPEAADPRVWLNGTELLWPMKFVFSVPATTVRPVQEKVTNFTVLETGAYLYQGLPTTTNWWIDDLAVGKERVGCN